MLAQLKIAPGPGSSALRRGRHSLSGQVYLVTTTTIGRKPWFSDFELARRAARTLTAARWWTDATLLCWTLMPDHLHAIIELGANESLGELVRHLKSASATEVNRGRCAIGSVWASGFHDHALRHEQDLIGVARYVVANPVRAGLVSKVADYPFWDAVWLKEHRG